MDRDAALFELACRLGDTTLILGHRVSEWCGHAPVLEEDIALANIALDLIGQTRLWLGLAGEIEGNGRTADDLAFLRDAGGFRNLLIAEQPNRDFGHTYMRQFLYDAFAAEALGALGASADSRLAGVAAKALKEVQYHLEKSSEIVVGLGDGTDESHARMQAALDRLWPYTGEMFADDAVDDALDDGTAPRPSGLRAAWDARVGAVFKAATLDRPESSFAQLGGKTGRHGEHLGHILSTMQFLQRAYPGAAW